MKPLTQPIKIVFFDIDETLYYKKTACIPESISQQVIPRLKAKGIIPAIATGRTLGAFPNAIQPLMNENGFELFVSINGQYNIYKDNIISEYPIETQRITQIIEKLKPLNIEYGFVTLDEIAVSKSTPEVEQSLCPIKQDYLIDPNHYLTHKVFQLLAFFPQERTAEVIESGILGNDFKEVRWHPQAVDLLKKTNSKALGISDVLAYFNIDKENAMAFGDGLNDLEMIQAVGFGVAMGNAESQLKAVADYVTLPIEQDGILDALQKLAII